MKIFDIYIDQTASAAVYIKGIYQEECFLKFTVIALYSNDRGFLCNILFEVM